MKSIRFLAAASLAAFVSCLVAPDLVHADPFPPTWGSGAVHFPPVAWPAEPADPKLCGATCGEWKPYTRFQSGLSDARTQDPSNGGTAPQNYVNISSSCIDKTFPSIYYALREGATPADDVIMFRWRVEQIANNYATGPSAGTFAASDPWSSALWSVLFDVDGDGFIDLAAHLDGSSGSPSASVDRIMGIWSKSPTQSLDYVNDPSVKLLAHNPTAFVDPVTSRILNFNPAFTGSHTASPDANWPNGSSETTWDYGTTRSKVVTTSPCNEYFVDYQIPVAMLDASALGGPKITRSTPLSMLFCTANSLNNPFQKDCAINRKWVGATGTPGPFGDYISFDQPNPYSQPIVSKVAAQGPNTCPGTYTLSATVQDTLAVVNGTVLPSVKAVKFFYYYDANADGVDNDGGAWTFATNAALKGGSLNTWTATWDATTLPKGQFLIGVQAVDDNTIVDDGATPTGVDNRTFSYVAGDSQNRIYVGGTSFATVPVHSPAMSPSASENWWGNPSVTGTQTALIGVALNACGVAPTLAKTASASSVATGGTVDFALTLTNALSTALTVSAIDDPLPAGFTYVSTTGGTLAPTASPVGGATGTLTWSFSPSASIPAGGTGTLVFRATAPPTAGTYANTATATTSFGTLTSGSATVGVDGARLSLSKTPGAFLANPDGATPLTYTLRYSNDSSVQVTAAAISDTLPAGVTFVSCSGGASCANAGGVVTWSLGTLAGGASGTVSLTVTVNSSFTNPSLANTATLAATDPGGNPVAASATSTVAVNVPHASIVLQKSASAPIFAPGANVVYTLSYANTGSSAASGVVITDVVPTGFSFVSATGGGTNSSGTVTWNIGSVAAGASGSVTLTLQAANPYTASDPQTNTASATWTGNPTPVAASVQTGVTQGTQSCNTFYFRNTTASVGFDGTLRIANTTVPTAATAADVTFNATTTPTEVVRFYQDPPTASDVNFSGNISTTFYITKNNGPKLTLLANVFDYDPVTGTKTSLGSFQPPDQSGAFSNTAFTFSVPVSGLLTKGHRILWTFTASSNNNTTMHFLFDGTASPSQAQMCTTAPANIVFSKSVDKATAAPGDALTYTLSFANTSGSTAATGATIVDTLPAGVTFTSATLNGASATPTGTNPYTFTVNSSGAASGTVAAGGSGTLVINATLGNPLDAAIASVTNNATIASTQTSAINASATTGITGRGGASGGTPALAITLAADRTTAAPGDTVTYTVTVVNVGSAGAANVTVSDVLPLASYYAFGTCSGGCTNVGGTLGWNVGSLAVGGSATYTFTMLAGSSGLPAGVTVIPDTASTAATGVATVTSNTVNVSLNGNPILGLSKSANPSSGLVPGGTVTYTMVVTNTGSAAASNVVVSDPIPANVAFTGSIAASAGTGAFDSVNNKVVFTVGTLAAGASATLSFNASVGTLAAGNITIGNTATATASNAPATTANASVTASAAPVLTLSKSGPAQVAFPAATLSQAANGTSVRVNDASQLAVGELVSIAGTLVTIDAIAGNVLTVSAAVTAASGIAIVGAVTYSLVYGNTGNASANAVTLTDTLPAGVTFVSATNGGTNAGGVVTWSLASIDAGASGVVQVTIVPTTTGSLSNNASISCATCNTATASVSTAVGGLVVAKRTTTPTASAGGSAAYVIDVTNTSSAAIAGITVTDVLSSGFTYASTISIVNDGTPVAALPLPTAGDATLAWGTFTIQPGKTLTVAYAVDIAASVGAATYQNEAGATPTGSTVPFDALATTAEDVTILDATTGIVEGYVFQDVDNDGLFNAAVDVPLSGVTVTITDSTSTVYTVATDATGFYTRVVATGTASVDVDDAGIPAGLSRGASFADPASVTVPSGSSVRSDTGYVSPSTVANLTVAKTHVGNFSQGQTGATYTLTASNIGTGATVGSVSVTDTLPAGLTATAIAGTGWTCTLAILTCSRSDALAAGASYEPITVTVDVAGNAAVSVTNAASVGGGGEVDTTDDTAGDPTSITPVADVGVTKSDGVANVPSGTSTSYTIVMSNAGPGSANGAVLTDAAVAGLSKTSVACTPAGGAVCPASPTTAQLEAGIAIPALPAGGSVTFTVDANVTASAGTNISNVAMVAPPVGTTDPNAANDSATDIDGVTAPLVPDLTIAKSHAGNFTQGQGGATYTITASNAGTAPSSGTVTVTDTLPAGLTATAISGSGWSCTLATLTCTRSDALATSASYPSITLTVNVDAAAPASVTNTATVSGGGETNLANDTASDPTTVNVLVIPNADVLVTKTNGGTNVVSGATTSYTIVVGNAGPDAANGAIVTDAAVAGLTKTTVSCAGETGGAVCPASPTVAQLEAGLAVPTLPAGSSVTFTVAANVTAGVGGSVTNTVTVAAPAGTTDPDATNNQASDTDTVIAPPEPDLTIAKTHVGNFAQGESGAPYTITVSNVGTAATSGTVTVTDTLPAGLTASAISGTGWSCTLATLTCTRSDSLATSSSYPAIMLSVDVDAAAPASVTNTAAVSGGGESNLANDSASDPTTIDVTVIPQADVGVTKDDGFAGVTTGAIVNYTIVVSNAGPDAADGALFADAAVAGLTKTAVSCGSETAGAVCPASPTVAQVEAGIAIPTLPAGSSVTFSVTGTVTAAGGTNVSNTANVAAPPGTVDANAANDSATDTDPVFAAPVIADLVVTKSNSTTSVTAGGTTTYTIVVSNVGPDAADGATFTDAAVAGLSKSAVSCGGETGGAVCPASPTVAQVEGGLAIPTLPSGSSVTFSVTANVTASAGANVANTASIAPPAGTNDPNPGDDTATDTDSVTATLVLDLAIAKSHVGNFTQGQVGASYVLNVSNVGTAPSSGTVTVTDALPAGLTATAISGTNWSCTLAPLACTRGDALAASASYEPIMLTVDVSPTAPASLTNVATVSLAGDANAANDSASDPTTIIALPRADLAVTKTDGVASVASGGTTTYTIVVSNAGPDAADGAVLADPAAAGLAKTAVACSASGGAVCPAASVAALESGIAIPTFPAGGSVTFTVDANVSAAAGANVSNTATIAPPAGVTDPNGVNDSASDADSVTAALVPDLAIAKTHAGNFTQGQVGAAYAITVSNVGTGATTGTVTVADALPAGFSATAISGGGWTCDLPTLTCTRGDALAPGTSYPAIALVVDIAVGAPASVTNTASVSTPGDPNPANDTATDPTTITAPAALGSISGRVWYDRNEDRRYDPSEWGRGGWVVELWNGGALAATTTSASDGSYTFAGLAAGAYRVRFSPPNPGAGPLPVNGESGVAMPGGGTPARCELSNIVLTLAGGSVSSVTQQSLPIDPSGVVYDSMARTPLAGATVRLLVNGAPVNPAFVAGGANTVVTSAAGSYAFFLLPGAPTGTYSLQVSASGYTAPSAVIAPSTAPPGFTGGAVTAIAGVPQAAQATTYYLQFALPTVDITHDNLPLDAASGTTTPPRAIPTLSEWALILLTLLMAAAGTARLRERGARPR